MSYQNVANMDRRSTDRSSTATFDSCAFILVATASSLCTSPKRYVHEKRTCARKPNSNFRIAYIRPALITLLVRDSDSLALASSSARVCMFQKNEGVSVNRDIQLQVCKVNV